MDSTHHGGLIMSQTTAPAVQAVDVRALINRVLDETNLADTIDIINAVMAQIPPEQVADALRQALVEVVRAQIGRHNVGPIRPTSPAAPGAGRPSPSWKVAAYRSEVGPAWRAVLRDRIAVANNTRKLLGECGYADLMVAANERFAQAAQNQAKGEWFARLAEAVRRYEVERLDALPAEVLEEVLTS
jgi:hypothetical protein